MVQYLHFRILKFPLPQVFYIFISIYIHYWYCFSCSNLAHVIPNLHSYLVTVYRKNIDYFPYDVFFPFSPMFLLMCRWNRYVILCCFFPYVILRWAMEKTRFMVSNWGYVTPKLYPTEIIHGY
jgi:hypothetical protein